MIRADMIPPDAMYAAWKAMNAGMTLNDAIAAALDAWQTPEHKAFVGSALDDVYGFFPAIILPLPKGVSDE